jgi:hypothetical protein
MAVSTGTTGYQGGDAGHGGWSCVCFDFSECGAGPCTSHSVVVTLSNGKVIDRGAPALLHGVPPGVTVKQVEIYAAGDWEQAGLYRALTAAAMQLAQDLENGAAPA